MHFFEITHRRDVECTKPGLEFIDLFLEGTIDNVSKEILYWAGS